MQLFIVEVLIYDDFRVRVLVHFSQNFYASRMNGL